MNKINPFLFCLAISLFILIGCQISIHYTNDNLTYYEANPQYHPPDWVPVDNSLQCKILNHTYFDRDNEKLIDIYATTWNITSNITNSRYCVNIPVRYYGEYLQSCRCQNASQVNHTIDTMFPIGGLVNCSVDNSCTMFQKGPGKPGYYSPNPEVVSLKFYLLIEWALFVISCICFIICLGYFILDKFKKRNYTPV